MLEVSEKTVALPTAEEVQVMAWWVSEGSCCLGGKHPCPSLLQGQLKVAPSLRMSSRGWRMRERSARGGDLLLLQVCGGGPLLPCPAPLCRTPSNWDLARRDHLFLSARCHGDRVA